MLGSSIAPYSVQSHQRCRNGLALLRQTFADFLEDDCLSQAAALAYYTVFSLPAVLVILVTVVGFVWGESGNVAQAIQEQFEKLLGREGGAQVGAMIQNANLGHQGLIATGIGAIVVLFSATGAVGQLQLALNRAWEVQPDPKQGGLRNFVLKRILSLGMILGIAFLMLVSLIASTAVHAVGELLSGQLSFGGQMNWPAVLDFCLSLVLFTLLFAAMYKVLPDARIEWRDVWVGSVVTALLFVTGKLLIGLYLGGAEIGSAFGAAGSLAIVFLWVYYSSLLVLLGAEFTQIWAQRNNKQIQPMPGASRVDE